MPTRQHAETTVSEFIGRPCGSLLAVPHDDADEIVSLYALVEDRWHRMFVDVEVFFLAECEPDPDDDLEAGEAYRDLAAELGVLGQVIEEFSFRNGVLDVRFRGGVALSVREVENGAMALQIDAVGGLRILMVEDNEAFAQVVSEQFLSVHTVTVVGSVEKALGMDAETFDVLLVDYDLPDGKGDAVVRAVRARGLGSFVVGISSHDAGNDALGRAGADATCKKADFARIQETLLKRGGESSIGIEASYPRIHEELESGDADRILDALFLLGARRDVAPPSEITLGCNRLMLHPDEDIRAGAISAIGIHWASPLSFASIREVARSDASIDVRVAAVRALSRYTDSRKNEVCRILAATVAQDTRSDLRAVAYNCLLSAEGLVTVREKAVLPERIEAHEVDEALLRRWS